MCRANPLRGAPRIDGELLKLGPDRRVIQPPSQGIVRELEQVGGLHHEYVRMVA